MEAIDSNRKLVEAINELSKKHLQILEEEDNEEKALMVINEINRNLSHIDTQSTKNVFNEIKRMGGVSFEAKLIAFVKAQPFRKLYQEILERIFNTVHDPKIRLH